MLRLVARLETRRLGKTGMAVAPLGLAGSFGIDGASVERAFHELGVNYFFVTPRMKGLVDGIKRLVASGHRDEIVIASGASVPTGWSVPRELAKVQRAFGVDVIDVFHLFWVQAHWYVTGNTWPAMRKLKEQGKVRALAVSCHDRPMARALIDELDLDVLMCRYNAAHRGAEKEIFATLPATRPGIVAYTATRWGKLLSPAAGLGPMTAAECYRFALGHEAVDVVLCGARTYEEIADDAAGVAAGPLHPSRLDVVRQFGDKVRATSPGEIVFSGF